MPNFIVGHSVVSEEQWRTQVPTHARTHVQTELCFIEAFIWLTTTLYGLNLVMRCSFASSRFKFRGFSASRYLKKIFF